MERRLAAIFDLDMVGYSRLVQVDERGTLARQTAIRRELIEPSITSHHGRLVKGTGDGVLAEFPSAVDAVECAAAIQRAMAEREAAVHSDRRIVFRIGINVGDIIVEEGDIYGDGVNVAARIQSLSDPGGIFISDTAFSQVKNKVELGFEALGPHNLKNIAEPIPIYRVLLDTAAATRVPSPRRRNRQRARLLAAAGMLIVLLVAAVTIREFALQPGRQARRIRAAPLGQLAPTQDPRRIATLYFEPRTAQEEVRFIAAGLTEALIDKLSTVSSLHVVSRNGVAQFRDARVPPDSIARALQVGTLVTGTVSMVGRDIRVAVSLVKAATGEQFGTEQVAGSYEKLFALEDTLAQQVAGSLLRMLGDEIELITRRAGTDNVKAWELVQRASPLEQQADALMQMGDYDAALASLHAADSLLAAAETMAPEWVEPTTRRGWLDYKSSRFSGFNDRQVADRSIAQGLVHAETAVRLEPKAADALELRGTLKYWKYLLNLGGKPNEAGQLLKSAESDLRAAVGANPQQASAWTSLSHLLMNQDRIAEGKIAALRSYEADPYLRNADLTLWRLFGASFDLGDGVEARRWCEEGRRRFPDNPRFRQCTVMVFAMRDTKPEIPKAWSALEDWLRVSPPAEREFNRHKGEQFVAWALVRADLPDSARAVAARARAGSDIDPTRDVAFWEAIVRSFLGDMDEAIAQWNVHMSANPDISITKQADIWYMQALRRDSRFTAR